MIGQTVDVCQGGEGGDLDTEEGDVDSLFEEEVEGAEDMVEVKIAGGGWRGDYLTGNGWRKEMRSQGQTSWIL